MTRDRHFLLLLSCFLLSGTAGLIYETAWTEELRLVFGGSELAVTAVLAAYMAGLMLGAAVAARWVDRIRRPILVYGVLELGIAITALAVPTGLRLASALQARWLGGLAELPESASLGSALFYLGAAFVVLVPPTAMMGATLPLLARDVVRQEAELGPRIAWLYTANTFGAAFGTLLAAFVLLPSLGLGHTIWVAVACNGLVFALAVLLSRTSSSAAPVATPPKVTARAGGGDWILPLVLVSGFVFLTYEVLWMRLLSHLLGGSIYAFATMLATFLVGLSLGSAAVARWTKSQQHARHGFALAQIGGAAAFYAAFVAVDALPGWIVGSPQKSDVFLTTAGLIAMLLLPGALCLGAAFPFAVRILAGDAADAGPASARVFAWNTLGAIAGAIAAGFFLLPHLHFAGTMTALVAIGLVLALAAAWVTPRSPKLAAVAVAAGLLLLLALPRTPWQVLRTSPLSGRTAAGDVAFYSIGRSSVVLLLEQPGEWRLSTNGLPESAILPPGGREGRFATARWLSLLPLVSRPKMRSLAVIGMGAGITLEAVPPSVTDVHVIELEPEVIRANQVLTDRRQRDPLADPRLRVYTGDARSALLRTEQRFDAIVSQPSHPWTAGASHLFTRELFTLVRDRLEPDGVFVQWIGLRFVDDDLLRSLVATLVDVFAYVEVFQPPPGGALLFLAGAAPLEVEEHVDAGLASARESWRGLGVSTSDDILLARVLDEDGARDFAAGAPLITDHRNLLQIRSPRILSTSLGSRGAGRLFADLDPLLRQAPREPNLYLLRRLLYDGQIERAERFTAALDDPLQRQIANALVLLRKGRRKEGERALRNALPLERESTEALAALVQLQEQDLIRGRLSPLMAARIDGSPEIALVVEGSRLAALRNVVALRELDDRLAQIDQRHPIYFPAQRLRIAWRQASGDPERARQALEILDPLLTTATPGPRDLMQRARLGLAAGDDGIAWVSLDELAQLRRRRSQAIPPGIVEQATEVLDRLSAKGADPRASGLRSRLLGKR